MQSHSETAKQTFVDVEHAMDEYLDLLDWRIQANANQGYSLGGLILNVAGKVTANYWLSHVFTPEALPSLPSLPSLPLANLPTTLPTHHLISSNRPNPPIF